MLHAVYANFVYFVLWRLIFTLKHLERPCAGCVRVLLSFQLLTENECLDI